MLTRLAGIGLMVVLAAASQGCATVTGDAPASLNFTLDGTAYRTFSVPVDQLRRATLVTLKRLDLELKSDEATEDGCRELVAGNGDRTIHVELDKLTARTTRMRITAKHGWMLRDRATAGEVLALTERALDDKPAVTQRAK
jgi:hypothetical protein